MQGFFRVFFVVNPLFHKHLFAKSLLLHKKTPNLKVHRFVVSSRVSEANTMTQSQLVLVLLLHCNKVRAQVMLIHVQHMNQN